MDVKELLAELVLENQQLKWDLEREQTQAKLYKESIALQDADQLAFDKSYKNAVDELKETRAKLDKEVSYRGDYINEGHILAIAELKRILANAPENLKTALGERSQRQVAIEAIWVPSALSKVLSGETKIENVPIGNALRLFEALKLI